MDDRRDEDIPLQIDQQTENLQKKIKDSEEKLINAEHVAQDRVEQAKDYLSLSGSAIQIAQQNSLIVLAGQYLIASILSMLFVQLGPIGQVLTWIPFFDTLSIIIYLVTLFCVQFIPTSINKKPSNFIIFLLHSITKIVILVFFTLWFESIRCELFYLLFALIIFYILNTIKSAVANKEEINLKITSNFFNMLIFAIIAGSLLALLVRANILYLVFLAIIGAGYSYYIMLALQRYPDHGYMTEQTNDWYLGAAQLDADLIVCCKLVGYHCSAPPEAELPIAVEEDKDQL